MLQLEQVQQQQQQLQLFFSFLPQYEHPDQDSDSLLQWPCGLSHWLLEKPQPQLYNQVEVLVLLLLCLLPSFPLAVSLEQFLWPSTTGLQQHLCLHPSGGFIQVVEVVEPIPHHRHLHCLFSVLHFWPGSWVPHLQNTLLLEHQQQQQQQWQQQGWLTQMTQRGQPKETYGRYTLYCRLDLYCINLTDSILWKCGNPLSWKSFMVVAKAVSSAGRKIKQHLDLQKYLMSLEHVLYYTSMSLEHMCAVINLYVTWTCLWNRIFPFLAPSSCGS